MDTLRVRVYNVRFGDAILITIPDRAPTGTTETRHILIDVGNALGGQGGWDVVFQPIMEDVQRELGGKPLDLYIMTHEHLDHVQGLLYAAEKLGIRLPVRYAWLTASAAEDYYETHPEAKKRRLQLEQEYAAAQSYLRAAPERMTPLLNAMLLNNDPAKTAECVAFLRTLATERTSFVHRSADIKGTHPFKETRFRIWAPEEDTTEYYGAFQPTALGVDYAGSAGRSGGPQLPPMLSTPLPPPGVDAGAFYNLVDIRRRGYAGNLLNIDRANNNTSLAFALEWRGWRLLFPGDAEQRSWKTMAREKVLKPVHFLKVSHHGSFNGTPDVELLDQILPKRTSPGRARRAVLSTYPDTYNNVPDAETLALLAERCTLQTVQGLGDGEHLDIEFAGE